MPALQFTKDYILENDRVLLRPLQSEDFDHLLPFSINEPTLWEYSLTPANGAMNLRKYIDAAIATRAQQTSYAFIVFDKKKNAFAGSTRFYDYQPVHNTVQLGYTWYGKDFQRTGLNKQCKFLLLNFAFENLRLHRVEFRADNNNARSIAAMKSIGCSIEGILRSNCAAHDNSRRDSIVLSILKDEWYNGIKDRLVAKIAKEKSAYK